MNNNFNDQLEQLFDKIINELPKTKLQKVYKAFSWQINSPSLDIVVLNKAYNSSLLLTILTCLIKGKMLLLGPSGTGKSTIVETAAQLIFGDRLNSIQSASIHCYPELTLKELETAFKTRETENETKGIEQISILFIDDLSNLNIETKTILNTLLEEGLIIHKNRRYELISKPIFATSNSIDFVDVRSRALQDRFHISAVPTGVNPAWIYNIVAKMKFKNITNLSLFLTDEELVEINSEINDIQISISLLLKLEFFISELIYCDEISSDINYKNKAFSFLNEYNSCEKLCRHCNLKKENENIICKEIKSSVSTRTLESLIKYFKAASWFLTDSNMITEEIVAEFIPFCFLHRIEPSIWAKEISNDHASRIPWIRKMWANSMKTFIKYEDIITEYRLLLTEIYSEEKLDINKLKKKAKKIYNSLLKMKTPAKYNYIVSLRSIFYEKTGLLI